MSHTLTLELTTGNAAFADDEGAEVARILKALALDFAISGLRAETVLRDANGNPVGTARVEAV